MADRVSYGWVDSMSMGELFLNAWAAPAVRSAAPIDLSNMAVMKGIITRRSVVSRCSRGGGVHQAPSSLVTSGEGAAVSAVGALSQAEIDIGLARNLQMLV